MEAPASHAILDSEPLIYHMVPICSTPRVWIPKLEQDRRSVAVTCRRGVNPAGPQYQPEKIASIRQAADEDRGRTIVWVTCAKSRTQHQPYPLACVELRQSPDDNGNEQNNRDKGFRRAELQRNKHRLHFNGSRPAQRWLNRIWRQAHSPRSLSACRLCVVRCCQACPLMLIGVGVAPFPPNRTRVLIRYGLQR
jgi:hypothetical protein